MKLSNGNIIGEIRKLKNNVIKLLIENRSLLNIICGTFSFIISVLFYYMGLNIVTSIIFMSIGIALGLINKIGQKYYTNALGIFSLVYFFSIGLSTLRLHQEQVEWKTNTWICIIVAYIMFNFGYFIREIVKKNSKIKEKKEKKNINITKKKCFILLTILFVSVVIFFLIEVIIRKELPMFSKDMASYQKFAVKKIHFITVSSALLMPCTYIYWHLFKKDINKYEIIYIFLINMVSIAIPYLIVSRHLMLVTIALTALVAIMLLKKKEILIILISLVLIAISWTTIGNFRNQNEEYLEKALEIQKIETKEQTIPVKYMQVYMYISMNYDNFDVNVDKIEEYSYGRASVYPFLRLLSIPGTETIYNNIDRIIPTFVTYPIIMTPYLDFGIAGIVIYMMLIGYITCIVENLNEDDIVNILLKALFKYALCLSFFLSLFSDSTFVFYVIIILMARTILVWDYDRIKIKLLGAKK